MWYHKRPLPLPIGKADSIIRFYDACLRVNSVYTCIPYVTNKRNVADSFKWRTAFFPSYILTFIEIEIDITTGSHQLKMRFLFAIVYKNGLFQILGFSPYQKKKNLECRMLIRNFAEDVPLIALHTTSGLLQKCYFQSSCGYAFMKITVVFSPLVKILL